MDVACRAIRIMHLCSFIGYDGPSRGILAQSKYTDKDRFHTTICEMKQTRHPELVSEIKNMGCGHYSLSSKKMYDPSIAYKLARCIRRLNIDILNTHNTMPCWHGKMAAAFVKIPVVFTLRNVQSENYKFILKKPCYYKPVIAVDCLMMSRSDKIVAVSSRLRDYYIKAMRIAPDKIISISNAIDLEQAKDDYDRETIKRQAGIPLDAVVVGIVGDLVARKGHACLIEAAKLIVRRHRAVRFLIVGGGPLREELLGRIASAGLTGYFILTGHVKNVMPFVSVMDIFTLPSFAEGISRALMESMAMGIPSVCSAIDGNLEAVIDGETGYLFETGNAARLAEKLAALIENGEKRKQMGLKAATKALNSFDMERVARRYEDLYIQVLEEKRGVGFMRRERQT